MKTFSWKIYSCVTLYNSLYTCTWNVSYFDMINIKLKQYIVKWTCALKLKTLHHWKVEKYNIESNLAGLFLGWSANKETNIK